MDGDHRRPRVAIATCAGEDVDVDTPILLAACAKGGVDATVCVWDDPAVDWAAYDLTVLRSTWDYAPRREEFLRWARSVPRLHNPYAVVAYSTDKHYLADLALRGLPVTPTAIFEVGQTPEFPSGDFVVKPAVGAGSIDAARYAQGECDAARRHVADLHRRGRAVCVQPYVHSVDTVGERALVFIDGTFSHAMTKGAMLNSRDVDLTALFKPERMSRAFDVEPQALSVAHRILSSDSAFADLLYARVDLLLSDEGWVVLELELVEPSLFLAFDATAADRFAAAIRRRAVAQHR